MGAGEGKGTTVCQPWPIEQKNLPLFFFLRGDSGRKVSCNPD